MSLHLLLCLKIYLSGATVWIGMGLSTTFPMFQSFCCSAECLVQAEVAIRVLVCMLITASITLTSRLEGISGVEVGLLPPVALWSMSGLSFLTDSMHIQLQQTMNCSHAVCGAALAQHRGSADS